MKLRVLIIFIIATAFFLDFGIPEISYAKGAKTVKVKSYKTKSGKTVKSHKRSRPSKK